MNKAFVRENENDDEEELEGSLQLPQGSKNYIVKMSPIHGFFCLPF